MNARDTAHRPTDRGDRLQAGRPRCTSGVLGWSVTARWALLFLLFAPLTGRTARAAPTPDTDAARPRPAAPKAGSGTKTVSETTSETDTETVTETVTETTEPDSDSESGTETEAKTGTKTDAPKGGPGPRPRPAPPRPLSDDPGIDRSIRGVLDEARIGLPMAPFTGPNGAHLRLAFRGYRFHCAQGACWYNGAGIIVYPTAWIETKSAARILRLGIGIGGAGETSQARERWWQHDFNIEAQLIAGLQYPWHLTPYFEFIVGLGALHRNLYNKDDVLFAYAFGFDVGVEWFAYRSFNLAASVGWRRSIVDSGRQSLYIDSATFSVGLGF